ncbi:MAG: leucyl aminopeptidase [Gammaproteobacteria bacterium]
MEYSLIGNSPENLQTGCVIAGIFEGSATTAAAEKLDRQTNGMIAKILKRGDMEGKNGEAVLVNFVPDGACETVLLVGLGKKEGLSPKNYRKALQTAVKVLKESSVADAVCTLAEVDVENFDWQWKCRQIVEIFDDACYQYTQTKSKPNAKIKLETVRIWTPGAESEKAALGLSQGLAIAKGMQLTKHLADLPGNLCTPSFLADEAVKLAAEYASLSATILEESDLEKLGMGAFLSVSRGSGEPAKLITLEYQGGEKDAKPVVLIGKGLTFDAGGISLKPGPGMDEMKYDMCGGASVLGTMRAVAELGLPVNVIGLSPCSENLPDGIANKPGDILTSMSGLTIEVLNTDAEGRLLLCDALTYAKKFDPATVIDIATLTGACLIALGRHPSGLLGNDDELCKAIERAAETACDSVWRLPLWEEFQDQLKSNFADMANVGGREAGTITAACFLSRFAEDFRWAHLDIAGTAWRTGPNKGATGRPVPLLTQYLIDFAHGGG